MVCLFYHSRKETFKKYSVNKIVISGVISGGENNNRAVFFAKIFLKPQTSSNISKDWNI